MPFFASWPGHIKPGESRHLMAFYDIMPTLAELAGVAEPKTDGISFLPELLGRTGAAKEARLPVLGEWHQLPHGQAARFGPWYAMREHPTKPLHVFDVEQDPGCTHDLAEERADLVGRAKAIFSEAHIDSDEYVNPGEAVSPNRPKTEAKKK